MNRNRRLDIFQSLPALTLTGFLTIVFLIRYCTVAGHLDMGCDIATYLSTMNAFFGQDPTGYGVDRPPLIALPLKVFTLVFGNLTGVKLLGVFLSVAIGIPFYLIARRVSHQWIAVAMTIAFVLTPAYSDMLTWGYLTMTGILFGLLALHFFLLLLEKPSKLNIVLTGLFASLIVGFHQLSLAFFAPLFFLLFIALGLFNRRSILENYKAITAATVVGVILSSPYVPLYLRLLQMQAAADSEASVSLTSPLLPWILGIVLSLPLIALGLRWTWQQSRNTAIMTGVLLFYSLALSLFILPPPFTELNHRAHYFMYPAIWILAGTVLSRLWAWQIPDLSTRVIRFSKIGSVILLVIVLSSVSVLSQIELIRGLRFFGYLDNTRWETVSWIRDNTPKEATIAVYPESLGWWIEAEARRNTATVTERDIAPYEFLIERSMIAERILSRNQGIENNNLRLATTYPHNGAPGNPAIGVYIGGIYHDIMMFDDRQIRLSMEGGTSTTLAAATQRKIVISGNSDCMTMITTYGMDNNVTVIQTLELQRGSRTAAISYRIQSDDSTVTGVDIPIFFTFIPKSTFINNDQHSIEVIQSPRKHLGRVATHIYIVAEEATPHIPPPSPDCLGLSFTMHSNNAKLIFYFTVMKPDIQSVADVTYYEVPQIIKGYSIDYLAVDFRPNRNLASELSRGLRQWLDNCPYYRFIDSYGDIRIYQVVPSALG